MGLFVQGPFTSTPSKHSALILKVCVCLIMQNILSIFNSFQGLESYNIYQKCKLRIFSETQVKRLVMRLGIHFYQKYYFFLNILSTCNVTKVNISIPKRREKIIDELFQSQIKKKPTGQTLIPLALCLASEVYSGVMWDVKVLGSSVSVALPGISPGLVLLIAWSFPWQMVWLL